MKKLLFIVAILAGSLSFAQQEISNSQQELSKNTSARVQAFNEKIDTKVAAIVEITKLDKKKHSELKEIVATKEMLLIRLDREGNEAQDYQGRRNDIMNNYQELMKKLLGESKFNLLQSSISPK
ncbi:hypothetical protein CW736_00830 [Nonlabens sp. MB-3u-79]|jgi:hypothetical protein|uniref:hypothetical protein n=1 Tax=Nonlabens sp. MB-3u-79 TaxID=2058134 RepID=UPI000C318123|nr:hypothetical protein [Nonlabens sp. MB-3u-79]AUC78046.1 hypothetical protein CW736_00830 [Nonlabens sp. MB-3u-79]|tara:strand:- start:17950 stop:18321 length:372 start_codon:yes stop_codon:yes gene_type:complete